MVLKTDTFDAKEDRLRETDATHQPWQSIIADGLPRVFYEILSWKHQRATSIGTQKLEKTVAMPTHSNCSV